MSQTSPNLGLPYLQPAQAQKHVTHNEALQRLDQLVQLRLATTDAVTPPTLPAAGETFALGAGATGSWAGQDGRLATWDGVAWQFLDAADGWIAWQTDRSALVIYKDSSWQGLEPSLDNLDRIGIGTTADATNRLAVSAQASLLSHAGADHRLTLNKAAEQDTASLVFQSNWVGHAEFGLAGENAFSVKVSPDGTNWAEALRADPATGTLSGAAVQAAPADATDNRLLRVGAFGLGETGPIPDIDDITATTTPAGMYRFGPATPGAAMLPPGWSATTGLIRVDRFNANTLRQTAWQSDGSQSGWHRVCDNGTWTQWHQRFDHGSILGPVVLNAGQPAGAIIERGDTANGHYIRLADGTQMCMHHLDTPSANHSWTFPAAFASGSVPIVHALARAASAARLVTENENSDATGTGFSIWDTNGAAAPAALMVTASGRWA